MNYNIFFSPTKATEKIVKYIGKNFQNAEDIDLSKTNLKDRIFNSKDFCIIGVPTFGGRVPSIAAERLKKLNGENTLSFLIVTYGGRAYEDTLKELQYILEKRNFKIIAAAAIITSHSIVPEIASDRPNQKDYAEINSFIEEVKERMEFLEKPITLPGNFPFKKYNVLPMDIEATKNCVECGICAGLCPVPAIPSDNPSFTDREKCISCMRCIYICPFNARRANPSKVKMLSEKLKTLYSKDKKNEFF